MVTVLISSANFLLLTRLLTICVLDFYSRGSPESFFKLK